MVRQGSWFNRLRALRNSPVGYGIAAGALFLALGLRGLLDPWVSIPFVTLFPAIIVAALFGGRFAGIAAVAAGGLISWYFWLEPRRSMTLSWPSGWANAGAFVLTSAVLLLLARILNDALDALARERDRANHLFAELQHRTANVMQNVSALLRQSQLQVRHHAEARAVLQVAQSRFDAMASIHRRLYEPEARDATHQQVIQGLSDDLLGGLGATAKSQVFAEDKPLDHRKLFTLCVLLAELIINSHKHAFSGQEGRIAIRLTEQRGVWKLEYTDNGPGLPQGYSLDAKSLGTRVLAGLAAQLGGTLKPLVGLPGARFELQFPGGG
jgi:two-component sensor histidine kinase